MALQDREIEIKFKVDEETFSRVRGMLERTAEKKGKESQADTYFTPAHRDFMEPRFPFEWLSIRRRGGKAILTYKHWYPENAEVTAYCDEFETGVSDPEQLEKIFRALDLKELVRVEKERTTFIFRDRFEVSLDVVKGLGHFIEIEALRDLGGIDGTGKRLREYAMELGLDLRGLERRGYPYQLMNRRGLVSTRKPI